MFCISALPRGTEGQTSEVHAHTHALLTALVRRRSFRTSPSSAFVLYGLFVLLSSVFSAWLTGCGYNVNGTTDGTLVVSPTTLDFGQVPVGKTVNEKLTLLNQGTKAVNVAQITVAGQTFTLNTSSHLPISINPGQTYDVTVGFTPGANTTYTGDLTAVDSAARRVAHCRFNGSGYAGNADTRQLSASTGTLNFGTVPLGSSATVSVTLTSTGNSAVTVRQAIFDKAGFAVSGATFPLKLNPQESATLQVQFKPSVAGSVSGHLALSSDDSTNSTLAINLQGTASDTETALLTATPTNLNFNDVRVGSSTTQPITLTARGTEPITISGATFAGSGFTLFQPKFPITLNPGQITELYVVFSPTDTGTTTGTLTVQSNASNATAINLSGTGTTAQSPQLTITPADLNFRDVTVNSTSSQTITLVSTGTKPVTVDKATIAGAGFSISGAALPLTLNPRQTATFTVQFAPATSEVYSGSLTIHSNSATKSTSVITLAGTGTQESTPQLTVSPSSISFGNVTVGSSSTQPLTLTSTGTAPVTVNSVTINGSEFDISRRTFPLTLNPKQSVTLQVKYIPVDAGASTGTVTIESNSSANAKSTINLTGNGQAATSPQLTASAARLSFGDVTVETSSSQPLTLTSTGTAPVTISAVNIAGSNFTLSGATFPVTLDPHQSLTLQLRFTPSITGAISGTLTLASNSATNANMSIALSGTGTPATAPQLSVSTDSLSFWDIPVGSSATQNLTLTSTGTAPVTISSDTIRGAGFSVSGASFPLTLNPQDTVSLQVTFDPVDVGESTGVLTINSDSSTNSRAAVYLSGMGEAATTTAELTVHPGSINFGDVTVGSYSTQPVTLVSSGTAPVTVNAAAINGPGFTVSGAKFPLTLAPQQTATLQVRFAPAATGSVSGSLAIASNSSTTSASNVNLSGTGTEATTPQLTMSAASLNFGNVTVGSSSTQPLTLTSTGTDAVTVNSATISGTGFTISGATFPLHLNPGQTVTLQVKFDPINTGAVTGHLTIASNSSTNPTAVVGLSGTGTAATSPQLSVSAASLNFGNVTVGSSSTQPLTLSSTGTAPVTINSASVTGTGFSISGATFPLTLKPQQTVTLQVKFQPANTGTITGQLTVSSNSSTNAIATVGLNGKGQAAMSPQLSVSAASLSFGDVTVGSPSKQPLTLTSTGTAAVTISALTVKGTGFSISSESLPLTLNPNQTLTIEVQFDPTTAGAVSGTLTISSNSSTNATAAVSLQGTGTAATSPQLTISAASLSFGSVSVGSSSTQTLKLTSSGTAAVTINAADISGVDFSVSGASFPLTLDPKESVTLQVQFAPTAAGAVTGQLTISSDSSTNANATVNLSGTGAAVQQYAVSLTWAAPSTSSDPVIGYHVYRSTGGTSTYQLLNSSVETSTTYTDSTVQSGTTYNYEVKSVDADGVESIPSNVISETIP